MAAVWNGSTGCLAQSLCQCVVGAAGPCVVEEEVPVTPRAKALHPKVQLGPSHLPKKSSLSGSSSYRSTSRSCPGTSYTMNWEEREVT